MADESKSRNGEVFRQIADQFPSKVPGDDYQFEYSFAVKLDFRDWRRVLVALQAADAVSELGEPVAWLIALTVDGKPRREVHLNNCIADYRVVDPKATVTPLYKAKA